MKLRLFITLLAGAMILLILSACSSLIALEAKVDAAEDAVERRLDAAEDAIENAVVPAKPPADSNAALTAQDAQSIALKHADLTADQVSGLRAEFEIDDRVSHYDVHFRQGKWEYEYEIHAQSGDILSFDKDD